MYNADLPGSLDAPSLALRIVWLHLFLFSWTPGGTGTLSVSMRTLPREGVSSGGVGKKEAEEKWVGEMVVGDAAEAGGERDGGEPEVEEDPEGGNGYSKGEATGSAVNGVPIISEGECSWSSGSMVLAGSRMDDGWSDVCGP